MLLVFLGVKYLLALKRYAGKVNTDCGCIIYFKGDIGHKCNSG
jgi:hypothetical protein